MKHNTQFLQDFMARYNYPEVAVETFTRIENRLDDEAEFGKAMDDIVSEYMGSADSEIHVALDKVKALAEQYGENEYTLDFIFILNCVPTLKERYEAKKIPENIFWDSCDDFRCKLLECIECEGVPGTFVAGWNNGTFKMTRFALGRFQFEFNTYDWENDFVFSCGKVMKPGDHYINFHIPSSGISLTDDVRLASYKLAYENYKFLFPQAVGAFEDGCVIFGCGSWLLYPRHREFLPEKSNILRFMDDFEIVGWAEKEKFGNDWRVFGHYSDLPYAELPRDTSLRRAYADWLTAGNPAGDGFGLFVFDGEKIVR